MARGKRHVKPSAPSSHIGSLECLETSILNNRGARYEGDIFSTLQHSPYALRSWEFALADGAIYCNGSFDWGASFAGRFSGIEQAEGEVDLLLFDVKSKISQEAGDQIYATTTRQEQDVAFYIGVCAADTSFVELIPNIYQQASPGPLESEDGPALQNRKLGVNTSRESKFRPSTYKLDPGMSSYRMPLILLPEAILRVRRCARGVGPYVNPWTLVSFPNWKPFTTHSTDLLIPAQDSQHFTAYKAALDICRMIKIQRGPVAIDFDFVGLQPRLADFKLITALPLNSLSHLSIQQQRLDGRALRQDLIQHKLDGKDRARSSRLSKVAIARGEVKDRRWYFSTFDRFDFLFYQFSFSNLPDPRRSTEFFFIPEHEIPDIFYKTHDIEVDFEDHSNFAGYRIEMDNEGRWVQQVLRIIMENPQPRKAAFRPFRTVISHTSSDGSLGLAISQASTSSGSAEISSGRGLYTDGLTRCHHQFYRNLMEHCARRQSGLVVFLGTEDPMGDFGLHHYTWTQAEQQDYIRSAIPPKTINDLPAHTSMVPVYYYVKDLECDFRGPNVTAAQFRRLNSCRNHRLIVWNLWGPDEPDQPRPLIVIPSEDLRPVHEQRALFKRNLEKENNDGTFAERTPLVSSLLSTGFLASDYKIDSQGPLEYDDGSNWGQVWRFFEQFLSPQMQPQHPKGVIRNGALYRCPLWKIHSRSVMEHMNFSSDVVTSRKSN